MSQRLAILHEGCISRFVLAPIERKTLHGFKRRIALDEQGRECASALLTRDGSFLLPAGATAEAYIDANGDAVKRSELAVVDANGALLPTLSATLDRPQVVSGPIPLDKYLDHVVTKVYALETETLDPALDAALRSGAIFRLPFRPRVAHTETPAFLLANEFCVFLLQAEPCGFDFVGSEQTTAEADGEDEGDSDFDDGTAFNFDLDLEAGHAAS